MEVAGCFSRCCATGHRTQAGQTPRFLIGLVAFAGSGGVSRLFAAGVERLQAAEGDTRQAESKADSGAALQKQSSYRRSSSRSAEIEVLDGEPAECTSLIRGTRAGLAWLHQLAAGWEDGERLGTCTNKWNTPIDPCACMVGEGRGVAPECPWLCK